MEDNTKLTRKLILNKTKSATSIKNNLWLHLLIPLFIVSSGIFLYFARLSSLDSDHLWSLAVGRWISEQGTVPFVDIFSWTVAGKEWFSNSWLFCWLLYKADLYLGYLGPALIILIVYLITGYFLYAICKRFNPTTFSTLIFTITALAFIIFSAMPRAYIYSPSPL